MSTTRSLRLHAGRVALAGVALTAGTALLVRLLDADHQARQLLGFDFNPPARRPGQAIEIGATNLRLVAAALLAAVVVHGRPQLRRPLDATLAVVLALNTATLGVALGAYGTRLIGAVALHAPLELAAFLLAGGAYLAARGPELTAGGLTAVAAVAVTLVAAGAIVETYVRIGGGS
jgi:protein-S-isoprenylcysteine O-methyltransferase Ste14